MKTNRGKLAICFGLLLITGALLLVIFNLCDEFRAAQSAQTILGQLEEYLPEDSVVPEDTGDLKEIEIPDYILNPDMDMPVKTVGGADYIGVLCVPALGLNLPVISQWSDANLRIAPCRYSGSPYLGDLIIAAHNYVSHFGGLKNLRAGDVITFQDMDGNVFAYEVLGQEILQPTAIEEMKSGTWDLTLFTCTLGGQSRRTIRCTQVNTG